MVNQLSNKTIQVATGTIEILEADIFYVKYHPDTILDIDDFKEIKAHYNELNVDQNLKILVEFQQFNTFTIEARNYAEQYPVDAVAEGIIFKGLAQRLIVRFYLLVNKQEHPVKVFQDKQKAIDWLNSL